MISRYTESPYRFCRNLRRPSRWADRPRSRDRRGWSFTVRKGLRGEWAIVASRPFIYSGQGFSLQRDKGRFVLPAPFRFHAQGIERRDDGLSSARTALDCIVGFGLSRKDEMVARFDAEEAAALDKGLPLDAVQRGMSLFSVVDVPFDGSGRFILPKSVSNPAKIADELISTVRAASSPPGIPMSWPSWVRAGKAPRRSAPACAPPNWPRRNANERAAHPRPDRRSLRGA